MQGKALGLFLAIAASLGPARGEAKDSKAIEEEQSRCLDGASSTADMHNCVGRASSALDLRIEELCRALEAKLDPPGRDRVEESHRAWLAFRDADMKVAQALNRERGTIAVLGNASEWHDILKLRAEKLEEYVRWQGLSQRAREEQSAKEIAKSLPNCRSGSSPGDLAPCIERAAAEADKRLNEVYKALQAKLKEKERALLKDAERKWLAFRDADLRLVEAIDPGSAAAPRRARRGYDLLASRVKRLEEYLKAGEGSDDGERVP